MERLNNAAEHALTENYVMENNIDAFRQGFHIGALWLQQQILENSTEIKVNRDFLYDIKQYIHEKYLDYKVGEKIRIALIKENDEHK